MNLSDYAGLKEAVASFLNKTNLASEIPVFIALAEAEMRREINSMGQVEAWTDVEVTDQGYVLPSRYEVESVAYCGLSLPYVPPHRQDEVSLGEPRAYTVDGRVVKVLPAGMVTIRAAKTVCPLSDVAKCNWVLKEHPDAYLYGALKQSAPFLRDDERTGLWAGLFSAAIDSINRHESERQTGGSNLVMRCGPTP